MCLAVPGRIVAIEHKDQVGAPRTARVDFQGSQVDANLVFTPEAEMGDWVLVHAGFAIQRLDEAEARLTWSYLTLEDVEEFTGVPEVSAAGEDDIGRVARTEDAREVEHGR